MTTKTPTPDTPTDGATRLREHYESKGLSLQVANQLVNASASKPVKDYDTNIPPEDLVVAIIARPGNYDACLLGLAKAYESQRERIADLEEDVERLRPREAFEVETLFEHTNSKANLTVYTDECGGIYFAAVDLEDDEQVASEIPRDESLELTTALNKWAGLDGVEWREICTADKPPNRVLLTNGNVVDVGHSSIMGAWNWDSVTVPTHWAPLPKPPVQS
jgi:hypothetical protein